MQSWRAAFNDSGIWFGFVQLAAYVQDAQVRTSRQAWGWFGGGPHNGRPYPHVQARPAALWLQFPWQPIPYERQAQLAGLQQPFTHVATAIDLGDATAPHGSVHPRNKGPVGARMAAGALVMQFGAHTPFLSPRYNRAVDASTPQTLAAVVSFLPDPFAPGFAAPLNVTCPTDVPADECDGISIYGTDGVQYPASAIILNSTTLLLSAPSAPAGVKAAATRYGWSPWPLVSLYSSGGFPVLPWWNNVD